MKTFNYFIKKIINKTFLYNKMYLISNKDLKLLINYVNKNKLPLIINSNYNNNNSTYFEFEKYYKNIK